MEEAENGRHNPKSVFVLFQTDVHMSHRSRVLFGIFKTKIAAIDAAKKNDLYTNQAEVVIVECELNKFEEQ